jgi:hypothetical protein
VRCSEAIGSGPCTIASDQISSRCGPNIRLKLPPRHRVLFGNCGLVFQLSLRYTRQWEAGQLSREPLDSATEGIVGCWLVPGEK